MQKLWFILGSIVIFLGLVVATVFSFLENVVAAGVLCAIFAVLDVGALFTYLHKQKVVEEFTGALKERDIEKAEEIAQKSKKSANFIPAFRFDSLMMRLMSAMARDRLNEAEQLIDAIRHNSGLRWRYQTAYCHILILLDKGENAEASKEYEDFRIHNEKVELYHDQLEVLGAIFARLFTHKDEKLPASAVQSLYPVVHRVLGKHFEEKAAQYEQEWN